jgi:UDPglucose 6-dehydrogenase
VEEAVTGADVVVLATEWPEYTGLNPKALALIARGRTVIDARNALDPAKWRAAGWRYRGLGRSSGIATRQAA